MIAAVQPRRVVVKLADLRPEARAVVMALLAQKKEPATTPVETEARNATPSA